MLFSKVEVDCFMVYDRIRMYSIGFTSEKQSRVTVTKALLLFYGLVVI